MRGAVRGGGKSFRVPSEERAQQLGDALDVFLDIGDLPVAPTLVPINDEWSISDFDDPVDAKDCAAYPASPYCENEWIAPFGRPFTFEPEIRTNGCETCLYIYPVIMWLKVQPTIICYRDPNCDRPPAPPPYASRIPKDLPDVSPDGFTSPECASLLTAMHRSINEYNRAQKRAEKQYQFTKSKSDPANLSDEQTGELTQTTNLGTIITTGVLTFTTEGRTYGEHIWDGEKFTWDSTIETSVGIPAGIGFSYRTFVRGGNACPPPPFSPIIPPPPLPPLIPDGNQRGQRGKKMCCNDCADAKENTDKLLKEIKEIKKALGSGKLEKALDAAVGIGDDSSVTTIVNLLAKRIGTAKYPIEVPESLLTGTADGKTLKAESNADYLFWLTQQIDALVGEFPIDIEVVDIDPLKEGNQAKKIQIPNIAEAIAEIYGLAFKSSVNQEVELNMLLRLALETTHAKNAAIIAQDYARGNAKFLGYQGNTKGRHVDYNFDFTDVNASQKDQNKQLNLESLLKNSKAWIQGWENDDSETAVNFLRKLMFSAGIIKSVFFRDKKQSKEVVENIKAMQKQAKAQDTEWSQFLKDINDPNSKYNVGSTEKPDINEDKSK